MAKTVCAALSEMQCALLGLMWTKSHGMQEMFTKLFYTLCQWRPIHMISEITLLQWMERLVLLTVIWLFMLRPDVLLLAAIYAKCLAPVACLVSFSGVSWAQIAGESSLSPLSVWNVLLNAGSSLEIKPISLVSLKLNDRFATLEHSLASLAEHVDKLNQEVNIVMNESLGVATGGETVTRVVVFDLSVISKMEKTLNNFSITVMSLSAKMDNAGSVSTPFFSINKIRPWIMNRFDGVCVFTSDVNSGYLSLDIAIIIDNFLASHVCKVFELAKCFLSVRLFFKNKLSVSILGLYVGALSGVWFSQADNINFLIAKAVNKSSFVILGGDFNEDGA
ncbi:hypothetical protein G9A89_022712 [Geosiphon pyriformis]|nr:hypothetical protein G9A89_022712 [Geosiphon pyriformis]